MKIYGVIGMILVQGSTLFQLVKFLKTKRTGGVSIAFWWSILLGLVSYEVYAISIKDPIYITSNAIGIVLSVWSIYLYYYYKAKGG